MRMSRIGLIAGLCATVLLGACKDFTASGDPLTQAEASELAGALVGNGFPGTGGVGAAPAAAAPYGQAAAPNGKVTITINDSAPCKNGGTAAIAGKLTIDVNETTKTGSLDYSFTLTPTGCKITTAGNKTFTLIGDPNIKGEGTLNWSSTTFNGKINYSGKFNWTADDGRTGACGVDLEANVNLSSTGGAGSASASVVGSVCGVTVDRNVTIES